MNSAHFHIFRFGHKSWRSVACVVHDYPPPHVYREQIFRAFSSETLEKIETFSGAYLRSFIYDGWTILEHLEFGCIR